MPSRRDFLRLALTTPLLPACAPRTPLATPPPAAAPADLAPRSPTPPSTPSAPTDRLSATAEALATLLRDRYGARHTDADWAQVRDAIRDQLRLAEQLRRYRLSERTEAAGHYYLAAHLAVAEDGA